MKRIYWRTKSTAPSDGHIWEYGYWGERLVMVRCARCRRQPLELMRRGGGFDYCRESVW